MAKVDPPTRTEARLPPAPSYADFVEFGGDPINAAIRCQAALSAGLEAIGQEVAQYGRMAARP